MGRFGVDAATGEHVATPAGFENKVAFVWKIADKLRGHFKPHQYGTVMLPTLVLFRLDAVLLPTKAKVVEKARGLDPNSKGTEALLKKVAGQAFYNTNPLTLTTVLHDDKNVAAQLREYIAAFSPGATEVLDAYQYDQTITQLDKAGVLYQVLADFLDADLHPDTVSNEAMGYIFEELLRRFSEMSNETAGEHYTPREVIRLMVNLLFAEDTEALTGTAPVRTLYDPAAGTGGMLIVAADYLRKLNNTIHVELYGEEINPETWAVARSELMIRREDADRMVFGNSFTQDPYADRHFDYMLANPPYGVDWKTYAAPIKEEAARQGFDGRFGAGLPRISDGSFLFLQHMISKMRPTALAASESGVPGSRLAIVLSGSPLFSGAAGSGESEIRRWIIENDWLEGIVALPDQMFYNTGISTYVWVVTNRKPAHRVGTVTLVDARELGTKMRKSMGDKRKELTDQAIAEISRLFKDAADLDEPDPRVKVMRNEQFGFARLTVERPKQPLKKKRDGSYEPDVDLRDQENIPLPGGYLDLSDEGKVKAVCEAAEKHLAEEIHPYVPDAWIDHAKTKIGYEIPFTRQFYVYTPPRPVAEIRAEIDALEAQIQQWMKGLA